MVTFHVPTTSKKTLRILRSEWFLPRSFRTLGKPPPVGTPEMSSRATYCPCLYINVRIVRNQTRKMAKGSRFARFSDKL